MRVLVVDDEPDFLATCVRLLALMGHEAITATNAIDALARIDEDRPGLVMTHLRMGPLGGDAVVERARRVRPALPVIVVTGSASAEAARRVRDTNVRVLAKPLDPAELKAAIQWAVSRSGAASL